MAYLKPFVHLSLLYMFLPYCVFSFCTYRFSRHILYAVGSVIASTRYNCSLFQPLSPKCYHLLRHFMQADATPLGGGSIRPSKIGWWVFVLILGRMMWRGDIDWKYANCITLHIFLPGYSLRYFFMIRTYSVPVNHFRTIPCFCSLDKFLSDLMAKWCMGALRVTDTPEDVNVVYVTCCACW